jgi:hypothetical protein
MAHDPPESDKAAGAVGGEGGRRGQKHGEDSAGRGLSERRAAAASSSVVCGLSAMEYPTTDIRDAGLALRYLYGHGGSSFGLRTPRDDAKVG